MFKVVTLVASLLAVAALTFAGCGGSSGSAGTTSAPTPTAASDTAESQPSAPADGLLLDISVKGENLEYDKEEMSAPAGQEVTVRFRNISKAQQHNWVLVENGTKDDVTADGVAAGADNHWVAPDDPRVFIQTGLLEPETTGRVTFEVPPAGTYQFVCTFPAHNIIMFGTFTSTP